MPDFDEWNKVSRFSYAFSYRFDIMLNYQIYMNMENAIACKSVDYQPPQVEIIEVEVEKGFTASNPYAIETVGVEQQEW